MPPAAPTTWACPTLNRPCSVLSLSRDFATGRTQATITPKPGINDVATIWYFATPPRLAAPTDLVLTDGDATLYYALQQYFFTNRQFAPMQEARQEY